MPPKATPKGGPRRKRSAADALSDAIVSTLTCPITSALCVRPVVAEDGFVYEREAIEKWLKDKQVSPLTNAKMGNRLAESKTSRQQVLAAIENGAVDAESAAAWHLGSAKCMVFGTLPGEIDSVKTHLVTADGLFSSPETEQLMRAAELKSQMDAILKEGGATKDVILAMFGGGLGEGLPMKEWRELREGISKIRIIGDVAELERLCRRIAPGCSAAVGWFPGNDQLCGKEYVVVENLPSYHAYNIKDNHYYDIPFDACEIVRY